MANPKPAKNFNIVLIGYRAVGKTTVAAQVAHRLGRPMIDLDAVVEQEAGESIPDLVRREGWAEFRRREKAVVERYASQEGMVLATGGGVILDARKHGPPQSHGQAYLAQGVAGHHKSPVTVETNNKPQPVPV